MQIVMKTADLRIQMGQPPAVSGDPYSAILICKEGTNCRVRQPARPGCWSTPVDLLQLSVMLQAVQARLGCTDPDITISCLRDCMDIQRQTFASAYFAQTATIFINSP